MDIVHLQGSEQVQRAGQNIGDAARMIRDAASQIESVLERFIVRFEDAVGRLEEIHKGE